MFVVQFPPVLFVTSPPRKIGDVASAPLFTFSDFMNESGLVTDSRINIKTVLHVMSENGIEMSFPSFNLVKSLEENIRIFMCPNLFR